MINGLSCRYFSLFYSEAGGESNGIFVLDDFRLLPKKLFDCGLFGWMDGEENVE